MNNKLKTCPVCNSVLEVTEYHCNSCGTTIKGNFSVGEFNALSARQQEFIKVFVCAHGNIKEVEKVLGISYPTVKNRLSEITNILCGKKKFNQKFNNQIKILEDLENGKIDFEEAIKKIGG
ncbi:MAG: hypothetical protein B6D61_13155 [Bacteroidetes bacterium 4484_249]|nr:MAG: hypothetical protein B6D61_13155 [Bacteroidetes bacterium 4484_249]